MSRLLGNASAIDVETANPDDAKILGHREQIDHADRLVRDCILLTNRRLIRVDEQVVNGKKVESLSIPYESIERFSVESAGHFGLEAERKIRTSGLSSCIEKTFSSAVNIDEAQDIEQCTEGGRSVSTRAIERTTLSRCSAALPRTAPGRPATGMRPDRLLRSAHLDPQESGRILPNRPLIVS
jgi:hypothetical protein